MLVEPEIPENTGFCARLCQNFGFKLRLVNPEFNLEAARKTAAGAQEPLRQARIFESVSDAVEDLNFVVGTKPKKGQSLGSFQPREDTSLMVGRESSGLTNRELELCDATVHISTENYDSLNQSHAAAVLMHRFNKDASGKGMDPAQEKVLRRKLQTPELLELVKRANPSKEEVNHLLGNINS